MVSVIFFRAFFFLFNRLTDKYSQKIATFNRLISVLAARTLNGPALVLQKSYFFTKEIRYKSVQYFNLAYAHKPKFGLFFFDCQFQIFFLAPFLSFFSVLCLLLPFAFFLAAVKSWLLIMGKAYKWDLYQLKV